jgi:hypothetical protein
MKRWLLAVLMMAVFAGACLAQAPGNLTISWTRFSPQFICQFVQPRLGGGPCATDALEGVWAMVWVTDPEIVAVSITLSYRDAEGKIVTTTEVVPRRLKDQTECVVYLFMTGKAKVQSILAGAITRVALIEPKEE